jgi:pyochelin biosynthesis protein PchC
MSLVVCLPPSGAGRSFFRLWPRHVARGRVVPLSRPGNEERMNEPLASSLGAAAADVVGRIHALEPSQVVLFGHSIGATVAFEAARLLTADRIPLELVVSARQAPHCGGVQLTDHTDAELLATVQSWGLGTLDIAVQEMMLPLLRADLALSAGYTWDGIPVSARVTTLSYSDDVVVDDAHVRAWADATSAFHSHLVFPGDHFAARNPSDSLIGVIRDALARLRAAQPRT